MRNTVSLQVVDGGRVCKCGRRTIEGNCFGCGLSPKQCGCPVRK